ncbi:MAG: ATP-binding cassette domain-containing protein, partial [Desulfobacterales bacterium]|nr:ATP-binding cassette domain-containing protein [Desulfobacterales bacterium]
MSIYKNVLFPLKLQGKDQGQEARSQVKEALKSTHLWEEVKDRLDQDARSLSGGQQQRLCMARALILRPQVLLLDEPTSSLDPGAGEHIEALLTQLKSQCTILLISHYMDQVNRIADQRLSLEQGRLISTPL